MKLSNAPVYYALAQVQFNHIPNMAVYVNSIQDILRRSGYTQFVEQEVTQLRLDEQADGVLRGTELHKENNWLFTKADGSSGFILGTSSIVYHTTNYDTHEQFLPELLKGLKSVHDVVQLEHLTRMGLRYLDAVIPKAGEQVDQYLADGLKGVSLSQAKPRYTMSESVFDTEAGPLQTAGTLVVRVYRVTAHLGYPPDLVPSGLVSMPRFQTEEAVPHAVIDSDHFVVLGNASLDFDQVERQLSFLHQGVKASFEATVTEHAKDVWR